MRSRLERCERVAVRVTFLRMDRPPTDPPPPFPPDSTMQVRPDCGVAEFRTLYDKVGADHLWWLRRTLSDHELAAHLSRAAVTVYVLMRNGVAAGFYELERMPTAVNINYFGLFPDAIGTGLGRAFLRHAVDTAWSFDPSIVTVNTCTADHPRALPTYEAAGFQQVRAVDEIWDVPLRLGLRIPKSLRRL